MCGRYALGLRPNEICDALQNDGMEVQDILDSKIDSAPLPNYNLAPGNVGLVYLSQKRQVTSELSNEEMVQSTLHQDKTDNSSRYLVIHRLHVMKWGLIPSWTKCSPDYSTLLKTINCRDDSLKFNKGLWNSMKSSKRCIVIAQGFFEWQKKTEKIPHFIKRKDGKLLCLAGLYDCVEFESTREKHYTYTIITTNSNNQLKFLHERMPVILENGSDELRTWLDPRRSNWSQDLQSLLRPFDGDLEIYPVSKDVGKLANNSPRLIVPLISSENKSNIANFFSKSALNNEARSNVSKIIGEAKCEPIQTSFKPTVTKQDIEDQKLFELRSVESTTSQIISQKTREIGQKRKLVNLQENELPEKAHQETNNTSSTVTSISLPYKIKNESSNNTPKPSKANKRSKTSLKITNFFK